MSTDDRPVILFDLDGTVLDSAPGIVAAQQAALRDVGIEPPSEEVLRSDLGPPPAVLFARVGVPAERIDEAGAAYRRHYLSEGIQNATVFPGVREVLASLQQRFRLATATMKLISTATPFLDHHRLTEYFEVVGGAAEGGAGDKSVIIDATCTALGDPERHKMIMVGDRHSDISGGRDHEMATIAVTWGYGSRDELVASGPDLIIDSPDQLEPAIDRLLADAEPH
ncbi:HAD hydrolase-like protein [Microlunatus soli]|uniref:HAD hydrolase-like protein n=1 Tax=Microlunatus soli TaxID=630515 RepID=UPI0012FA8898|nr:HAD hydrolase-like protein [Microlunatus soli]